MEGGGSSSPLAFGLHMLGLSEISHYTQTAWRSFPHPLGTNISQTQLAVPTLLPGLPSHLEPTVFIAAFT